MWNLPLQVGLATATANFSTEFSWVGAGLFGAVMLSAGMIIFMILRDRGAESLAHTPAEPETIPYQEAA